jgi:hypothetical protein
MNVSDAELTVALALTPRELGRYLAANGWRRDRPYGRGELWTRHADNVTASFEVLVPRDRSMGDYASRITDLLETLAVVEDRPLTEVISELTTSGMDVPSVRLRPDTPSGTVPLPHLHKAVASARELLLSAATSALAERPALVQAPQRPALARTFTKRVNVGTAAGSFVLRLLIPLSSPARPGLPDQRQLSFNEDGSRDEPGEGEPFERRVSLLMFGGVVAAHRTAARALATDGLDFLRDLGDAARLGLSANLCDALAGFAGEDDEASLRAFDVRFSWSTAYPMAEPTPVISFPSHFAAPLRDTARYLRDQLGEAGVTVRGTVIRLHRESRAGAGEITLKGSLVGGGGMPYRIRVSLSEQDYSRAASAHDDGDDVEVTGDLVRRGTRRVLLNPRDFTVLAFTG